MIRLPDFVTKADFDWAVNEATKKKKTDFSKVEYMTYDEGLSIQCMHIGSYDDEPRSVALMHEHMEQQGYSIFRDDGDRFLLKKDMVREENHGYFC